MIAALLQHTLRVLTFRHDGRGLPNEYLGLWLILVAACLAVTFARWGTPTSVIGMFIELMLLAWWSVPLSSGAALASLAVDGLAMLLGLPDAAMAAWELTALLALIARHVRYIDFD